LELIRRLTGSAETRDSLIFSGASACRSEANRGCAPRFKPIASEERIGEH
jgi:hypothetical protein